VFTSILIETCLCKQENHHETDVIHDSSLAGLLRPSSSLLAAAPETGAITQQDIHTQKARLETLTREISQQHGGQLARFEDAVCIAVSGFEDPYNTIFAQRMAQDAEQAGLQLGKAGCHPNIVVLMTDHPQQELMSLIRHDSFISSMGVREKDVTSLAKSTGPTWTLTFTELRNTDGNHAMVRSEFDDQTLRLRIYDLDHQPAPAAGYRSGVDGDRQFGDPGKTLTQIADYAALRSLADLKSRAPVTRERTILTLFQPGSAPDGLTPYDLAYLKGLYSGPSSLKADMRMHEIVSTAIRDGATD
jgi:hypothetical protein